MNEIVVIQCPACAAYLGGATVDESRGFDFIGEMVVDGLRENLAIAMVRGSVTLGSHTSICPNRDAEPTDGE